MINGPTTGSGATASGLSVLLVDDDAELSEMMQEFFARRGIRLEAVHDGRRGLSRALGGGHDLLLLDVMMPGLDGFELLRLLRRQSRVPVIMLTARTAQVDRVAGLDAGADDYLPKPFGPEELLARIRAVLRRAGGTTAPRPESLEVGGVRGRPRPPARPGPTAGRSTTTSIEFDLLELLIRSAGRILSRNELMAALYQRPASPFDRALDVHVSHLRKKLGDRGDLICTVRGSGYLFRAGPRRARPLDEVDLHHDPALGSRHDRGVAGRLLRDVPAARRPPAEDARPDGSRPRPSRTRGRRKALQDGGPDELTKLPPPARPSCSRPSISWSTPPASDLVDGTDRSLAPGSRVVVEGAPSGRPGQNNGHPVGLSARRDRAP